MSKARAKRVAIKHPAQPDNKQRKLLSTEVRHLRSNVGLRARIHAEEEAAAHAVTITNQEQSPFFQLPGELRVRIYALAIGGHVVTPDWLRGTDVTPDRAARYRAEEVALRTFRGVVLSCRAIKAETESLLYQENIFVYRCIYMWDKWVSLLDEKRCAAIQTIRIPENIVYNSRSYWTSIDRISNLKTIIVDEVGTFSLTKKQRREFEERAQKRHCRVIFKFRLLPPSPWLHVGP